MAYTPTPWVDGTTPVNAANLNKIETGLSAADALAAAAIPSAQKAAANGVASLDSGGKVPLTQLPSGLGGGVDYIGDWGADTAYKQGDVVRYQGVDYLAVNPSTGQTPPALATPASGYPAPVYSNVLPASPVNGQEAILVDSLTAPTFVWRFRYNAGSSSPYKWEFIGGAPASIMVSAAETLASAGSWLNLATNGPLLAVPRNGDYLASAFSVHNAGTTVPNTFQLGLAVGDTTPLYGATGFPLATATQYGNLSVRGNFTGLTAGQIVKMRYQMSAGTSGWVGGRVMEVIPVRVA